MTECNRDIDCRSAVQKLWDYLDQELTPERMDEVRRHLERCGDCLPHHEYGRVVLMGGVGMLGGDDLALPYPWIMRNSITVRGQWMYPRTANVGIIRLLTSGTLDLAPERVRSFGLDAVNDAIAYAAAHGGPFDRTSLTPSAG